MDIVIKAPITVNVYDDKKLDLVLHNLGQAMLDLSDIAQAVTDLNTKVTDLTTSSDGVLLIVTELNDTVQQLKVDAGNTIDPAQKQAIIDQIGLVSQAVADQAVQMHDAIVANTPVSPVVIA